MRNSAFDPAADVADKLAVFENTRWKAAVEQERLDALQALVNVEATDLSLPNAMKAGVKELIF